MCVTGDPRPAMLRAVPGLNLDSSSLLAAVFWGAVASGYLIYGWKQKRIPALVGGVVMMVLSYFVADALWMSVASVAVMAGIWYWSKNSE